MLKIVLLACVAVLVIGQQGQHGQHGNHHNHIVHGSVLFFVDEQLSELVMESHTHCFMMPLTDADLKASRDPDELEKFELKMVALTSDPMMQHNTTQTDRLVNARCKGKDVVELKA